MRIGGVIDLVAAEGWYHRRCYQSFLKVGSSQPGTVPLRARQADVNQSIAFKKLCAYIESNDECQYILDELVTIMSTLEPTATPYSSKHLKRKLKDQYGECITITEVAGKSGVVCFSGCMNSILTNQWYKEREENAADEVKRVIHTAAMLIRREIRSRVYNCEVFPSAEHIASGNSELVPDTLRLLIDGILKPATPDNKKHERKSVTIQHAIVAAVRPRSFVSPLQVGLGIHLHRKYGSRVLIDMLSNNRALCILQ